MAQGAGVVAVQARGARLALWTGDLRGLGVGRDRQLWCLGMQAQLYTAERLTGNEPLNESKIKRHASGQHTPMSCTKSGQEPLNSINFTVPPSSHLYMPEAARKRARHRLALARGHLEKVW